MITRRVELEEACEFLRGFSAAHRGEPGPALVAGERRLDRNPLSD
jgi:hypothetical protein